MDGEIPGAAADFLRALADPDRLRVAAAITVAPRTAAAIAAETGLPIAAVVRHLRRLGERRLVRVTGVGQGAVYAWNVEQVRALAAAALESPRARALAGARDERDRVLAAFVHDGRLTRLPAVRAKQQVVLAWLAERFDLDRTYTEREVNAMLKPVIDDYSTARRMLVDDHYLNRQDGVYWAGAGRREPPPAAPPAEP